MTPAFAQRIGSVKSSLPVALEGVGFAIPISVGAVALVFAKVGTAYMAPGLLAALIGMALMHVAAARNGRPMIYSVRVLEASLMLGFLDHFVLKMPGWGLADTPAHRLMLVIAMGVGAALLLPLGYLLRLQRFARMIPAPVFAGFSTALGLTLVISQTAVLWRSWPAEGFWFICVALLVLGSALSARRFVPQWPPGIIGLGLGTLAAVLLGTLGLHAIANVQQGGMVFTLPPLLVPWADAWAPGVDTLGVLRDVVLASGTLALMVFLNTIVNEEAITQMDDKRATERDWKRITLAQMVATLCGSPLLTASIGATRAAARVGSISRAAMLLAAAISLAVVGSGVLTLVPLAAICGLLLFDGWNSFDRPSARLVMDTLRGRRLVTIEREDLITIGLVAVTAVLFNMVIGVFVGVFAGLVLYAWRNGRRLARTVATGATVRSNCTRSGRETTLLAEHSGRVRFIALEGALFFGAASGLQTLLREQAAPGHYVVVDWSHVISADSTVASAFARAAADARLVGAQMAVTGLGAAGRQVGETLEAAGLRMPVFPDADRALEWAENEVIGGAGRAQSFEGTALQEALSLLHGLSGEPRDAFETLFEQRFFRAGETVFSAGQRDSELMVILQGSVDILVPHSSDRDVRLARIRRGAMLGELSFLDSSARAATAVATEELLLGVLSRERFDEFARQWPGPGQRVLANLALDLAFRLRRTNQMAVGNLR